MSIFEFITLAFPAIFFILNPFSAATVFLSLTPTKTDQERKGIARRACLTAFFVLFFFIISGHLIFKIFNISIPAFRLAGGIIIFTIGMNMLRLQPIRIKQTDEEVQASLMRTDVGVIPLGIPIMSGPGAITTVIVLMGNTTSLLEAGVLVACAAVSVAIIYYILIHSTKLLDLIKVTGMGILTRVMGLIICVIAAQFFINGIKDLLPEFARLLMQAR